MPRIELKHISVRPPNPFSGWQHKVHRALLGPFVAAALLVWSGLWLSIPSFATTHWPDGLLLVTAAAATLAALSLQLPAQSVVLAAVLIGLFAGIAQFIGAATAIPFGPIVYNKQHIGNFLFYTLPWVVPVIWVIVILNSRGVARLMLRPRRRSANYGLWVIGLTILLAVLFDLSLEPFATQVKEYWSWKPTKIPSDWYSTPWVNFLGWAVTSLLILLFVTPVLINKSPLPSLPTYHPLLIWELLSFLFLTGGIIHHLWAQTALTSCQMLMVLILSLLGATSKTKRSQG
jgi:putative membrane protein